MELEQGSGCLSYDFHSTLSTRSVDEHIDQEIRVSICWGRE